MDLKDGFERWKKKARDIEYKNKIEKRKSTFNVVIRCHVKRKIKTGSIFSIFISTADG